MQYAHFKKTKVVSSHRALQGSVPAPQALFCTFAREEFLALVLKFLEEDIADGLMLFIPF